MYSGVGGGCMLALLMNFPARQEISALKNMDPGKVKALVFYKDMIHRWSWKTHLEQHVRNTKYEWFCSKPAAPLEMAGGCTTVLYGQERATKPDLHRDIDVFLQERSRSVFPTHYRLEYMDECTTRI